MRLKVSRQLLLLVAVSLVLVVVVLARRSDTPAGRAAAPSNSRGARVPADANTTPPRAATFSLFRP